MSRWKTIRIFSEDDLLEIEDREAVYVFMSGKTPVYVGETTMAQKRMQDHFWSIRLDRPSPRSKVYYTPWGSFRRLILKVRYAKKYGESAMAERRLILKLNPCGNYRYSPGTKQRSKDKVKQNERRILDRRHEMV